MDQNNTPLTYKDAGVDIEAGNALVHNIKSLVKQTHRPEVLNHLGGFAALFELPLEKYQHPVLVSGTDGVGTKLKLAIDAAKYDTIGIDLVAMCVNDIIVCGAEPLFFLDYYATAALDVDNATDVVAGIAKGCTLAGAALIGGETAEMPGLYAKNDFDLAGFCVGIVEKNKIIDAQKVSDGDVILGLASSGPHSNGYSLIRRIMADVDPATTLDDKPLLDILLEPTKIYVKSLLALLQTVDVHAIAHITGGGFYENIPRVLPENMCAVINKNSWEIPAVFQWLKEQGNIAEDEMHRTFNCGIGMVLCVSKNDVSAATKTLTEHGETVFELGEIQTRAPNNPRVILQ